MLEDLNDSEPANDLIRTDDTAKVESKKNCDLLTPKGNTVNNKLLSLSLYFIVLI